MLYIIKHAIFVLASMVIASTIIAGAFVFLESKTRGEQVYMVISASPKEAELLKERFDVIIETKNEELIKLLKGGD